MNLPALVTLALLIAFVQAFPPGEGELESATAPLLGSGASSSSLSLPAKLKPSVFQRGVTKWRALVRPSYFPGERWNGYGEALFNGVKIPHLSEDELSHVRNREWAGATHAEIHGLYGDAARKRFEEAKRSSETWPYERETKEDRKHWKEHEDWYRYEMKTNRRLEKEHRGKAEMANKWDVGAVRGEGGEKRE